MSVTSSPQRPVASPTVAIATLGCKTNQFESAAMQESLQGAGYAIVPLDAGADLVIVNTCTVTSATDAQSRNLIRRARRLNDRCRVIVTGCYAQVDPQALQDLPGVSLVIGNEEKQRLLEFLGHNRTEPRVAVSDIRGVDTVCLPPLTSFAGRSRAFVQIQNGCDAFCSYCIIPYARGSSRSAFPDDILTQIKELVRSGYQEVVLTGIHIGGYGADLDPVLSLNDLVRRIEGETTLPRLRLGSIEPTELSEALLTTLSSSRIVCPHLHIPLQSGDDAVLQRMGRTYTCEGFAAVVARVRQALPDAAICLDVITGFPGETDEEFDNTYAFVDGLPVTDLHVFPYSRRPGTPAASMPGQIHAKTSKERAARLRALADVKQRDFAARHIGRELEVVVEAAARGGFLQGVSRNYLDVRFPGQAGWAGQRLAVRAHGWDAGALVAEVIGGPFATSQ